MRVKVKHITGAKLLTFFLLFLISCQSKRLDIDISQIQIEKVEIKRLDQDLFQMPSDSLTSNILQKKYGIFYTRFISSIINKGGISDPSYIENLRHFLADKDMREAYTSCQQEFPELNTLENELEDAFKHFKFYFPKREIPQVVTFMSGFNYSIVNIDHVLGIGLEMYLGPDNKFYKMIQFPRYKTLAMSKDYLLPDCIKGWMSTEFEPKTSNNNFLSQIIQVGKIMYLVDAILPKVEDTLKVSYTKRQLDWCESNEFNVWTHFIQQKLLYSTDNSEILKYTSEGPFTAAFSKESPSRIGNWIGWQIVRAYMDKNPEVTLQELVDQKDAQLILSQSKYKPKKS